VQLRSGLNFDLTDLDHKHTYSPTGAVHTDVPPNGMPVVLLRNDRNIVRDWDVCIRLSGMWVCMAIVYPASYPNGVKVGLGGSRDHPGDICIVDGVGELPDAQRSVAEQF
jgi:hypothetical protein